MALRLNTEMTDDELRATYRQLNTAKPRYYLHHLRQEGFGVEMKHIAIQMATCFKNDIEFRLCLEWGETPQQQILYQYIDLADAFIVNQYPLRWLPKMLPVGRRTCKTLIAKLHNKLTLNVPHRRRPTNINFDRIDDSDYLTGLIDGQAESKLTTFLRMAYNPSQAILQHVNRTLAGLVQPYIAVHIRRGDKPIDRNIFDKPDKHYLFIPDFWQAITKLDSDIKNVVVATDDYAAFEEFKAEAPAGYSLTTLCPPNRLGHDPNRFKRLDSQTRQDEFLNWFVDVELMLRADLTLVADYSGYGGLVRYLRTHRQLTTIIVKKVIQADSTDGTITLIRKPSAMAAK